MKNRVRQIDAASRGRNVTMKEFHLLSNGIEQVFAMFDAKVAELEFRIRALEPKTAGARFDANGKVITDDVPQTTAPAGYQVTGFESHSRPLDVVFDKDAAANGDKIYLTAPLDNPKAPVDRGGFVMPSADSDDIC